MGSRPLKREGEHCPGTRREERRERKGGKGRETVPCLYQSLKEGTRLSSARRPGSRGCARGRDAEPGSSDPLPTLPEAGLSHRGGVCAGRRARELAAQSQHSSCRPWLFSLRRRWGYLAQKPAIPRGQRQRRSGRLLPWPCGLGCFPPPARRRGPEADHRWD